MPVTPRAGANYKRSRRAFPDSIAAVHAPEASNVNTFHHMHM
ncbi:hypothetical protein [Nocardia nova]|nr:hypothetical protein [Nocardia nova]